MTIIQAENVNHPHHRQNLKEEKYSLIRDAIMVALPSHESEASMPFTELEAAVRTYLTKKKIPAELFPKAGSVRWYTKAVQLDLEAKGEIERLPHQSPIRLRKRMSS